ncbi:rust resistance kinase Lr10 [Trifolium repens]|nr:rust resistance kinase Lr10 [Trifolium repens]
MLSLTSDALTLAVVVLLLTFPYNNVYGDEQQDSCSRSCGVHNISHPFRLKDSPENCGDRRYNLSCENNNQLILYYESFGKYYGKFYVQSINYDNFTIRLLDSNLGYSNYSLPTYSLGLYNFSYFTSPYLAYHQYKNYNRDVLTKSILYVSCPSQYSYVGNCMNSTLFSYKNYFYVDGYNKSLSNLDLGNGCRIEFMYLTSWPLDRGNNNSISCMDIRRMLVYGFELSWFNSFCKVADWLLYAELDQYNKPRCVHPGLPH